MGGCCCCASKGQRLTNPSPIYPHPKGPGVHQPLSSNHGAVSTASAGHIVDTNSDRSIPVTFRALPVSLPYETYVGCPRSSHGNQETPADKNEAVQPTEKYVAESNSVIFTSILEEEEEEEDVCPTCLEEYDTENPRINTKCEHHFHLACIFQWMETSDTCPVCDQEMVVF